MVIINNIQCLATQDIVVISFSKQQEGGKDERLSFR